MTLDTLIAHLASNAPGFARRLKDAGLSPGSIHSTDELNALPVIRKDDRVAILQMPYGLEAFAPLKHMRKEDGTMAEADETLTVKVIEFNRDDKRIMVSHSSVVNSMRRESRNETVVKVQRAVAKKLFELRSILHQRHLPNLIKDIL